MTQLEERLNDILAVMVNLQLCHSKLTSNVEREIIEALEDQYKDELSELLPRLLDHPMEAE